MTVRGFGVVLLLLLPLIAAAQVPTTQIHDSRFDVQVSPEMLRHSRILDTLYFSGFVYGVAVLVFLLASGISWRMRDLAERITGGRRARLAGVLVSAIYAVLFSLVTFVMQFPLSFYASYVVPHQFDLSEQDFPSWLADEAKELGVEIILSVVAAALVLLAMRMFRRWWLVVWLGSIPVMIFVVIIAPVIIDPLFNDFRPLRDPGLAQTLLEEASRAGIEVDRVFEVDKSRQTTTMNAYVTGIGPTKRIVLWDTLLDKMTRDEIVAVMGHEMGHYVLHHLWKGLAFSVAIVFVVLFLAQPAYERALARWGGSWGLREKGDAASLPVFLLIVSIVVFLLSPAINGYSRHIEHEADVFGLELTGLNEPMASSFVKFAEDSKVNPRPSAFIEFWRYSHPSLARRIDFALAYRTQKQKAVGSRQKAESDSR